MSDQDQHPQVERDTPSQPHRDDVGPSSDGLRSGAVLLLMTHQCVDIVQL